MSRKGSAQTSTSDRRGQCSEIKDALVIVNLLVAGQRSSNGSEGVDVDTIKATASRLTNHTIGYCKCISSSSAYLAASVCKYHQFLAMVDVNVSQVIQEEIISCYSLADVPEDKTDSDQFLGTPPKNASKLDHSTLPHLVNWTRMKELLEPLDDMLSLLESACDSTLDSKSSLSKSSLSSQVKVSREEVKSSLSSQVKVSRDEIRKYRIQDILRASFYIYQFYRILRNQHRVAILVKQLSVIPADALRSYCFHISIALAAGDVEMAQQFRTEASVYDLNPLSVLESSVSNDADVPSPNIDSTLFFYACVEIDLRRGIDSGRQLHHFLNSPGIQKVTVNRYFLKACGLFLASKFPCHYSYPFDQFHKELTDPHNMALYLVKRWNKCLVDQRSHTHLSLDESLDPLWIRYASYTLFYDTYLVASTFYCHAGLPLELPYYHETALRLARQHAALYWLRKILIIASDIDHLMDKTDYALIKLNNALELIDQEIKTISLPITHNQKPQSDELKGSNGKNNGLKGSDGKNDELKGSNGKNDELKGSNGKNDELKGSEKKVGKDASQNHEVVPSQGLVSLPDKEITFNLAMVKFDTLQEGDCLHNKKIAPWDIRKMALKQTSDSDFVDADLFKSRDYLALEPVECNIFGADVDRLEAIMKLIVMRKCSPYEKLSNLNRITFGANLKNSYKAVLAVRKLNQRKMSVERAKEFSSETLTFLSLKLRTLRTFLMLKIGLASGCDASKTIEASLVSILKKKYNQRLDLVDGYVSRSLYAHFCLMHAQVASQKMASENMASENMASEKLASGSAVGANSSFEIGLSCTPLFLYEQVSKLKALTSEKENTPSPSRASKASKRSAPRAPKKEQQYKMEEFSEYFKKNLDFGSNGGNFAEILMEEKSRNCKEELLSRYKKILDEISLKDSFEVEKCDFSSKNGSKSCKITRKVSKSETESKPKNSSGRQINSVGDAKNETLIVEIDIFTLFADLDAKTPSLILFSLEQLLKYMGRHPPVEFYRSINQLMVKLFLDTSIRNPARASYHFFRTGVHHLQVSILENDDSSNENWKRNQALYQEHRIWF